jgi:hypothetical protein
VAISIQLKHDLFQRCLHNINQRIETITQRIESIQESRNNETKSSAGDKFETGRAMMQIEEDKNKFQLAESLKVKNELFAINLENSLEDIAKGSLVQTNNGIFFISIGVGKIVIEGQTYFCISELSPMGQLLKNKTIGEQFSFRDKKITIDKII